MKPSFDFAAIGFGDDVDAADFDRAAVGRRMPAIMRSVVVLPAPLGPRNPNSSPARHLEIDRVDRGEDRRTA